MLGAVWDKIEWDSGMRSDNLIRTAARGERVSNTVGGQVSDCSGKQARFCAVSIQSSFSSLPLGGEL